MTALDFILHDNGVILAMDTLALNKDDREPFKMVTKFFPIPHMNCLICGTGNMNAILDWFVFIEKNIIANGIYQLNKLTTACIDEFMKEHNGDNSCSIYQFGLHELDHKFHGYVYRSINGFVSEEIKQGIAVKPPDAFEADNGGIDIEPYLINNDVNKTLSTIMHKQKLHDENLDKKQRLGIGGIIQIVYMSKDSFQISNFEYFDDYEDIHIKIMEGMDRLNKSTER